MGNLSYFNVQEIMDKHKTVHLVETGLGHGSSILHAAQFPFETISSCDTEQSLVDRVRDMEEFSDKRMFFYHGESPAYLEHVLSTLPVNEPILFWLDAHFPGADVGARGFGDEPDWSRRIPLEKEFEIIKRLRPEGKDVILVDDLRIWLDDLPNVGSCPDFFLVFCPKERNIYFVHKIMAETHYIEEIYGDQGYLKLAPKG